jgi:hypothetical protein
MNQGLRSGNPAIIAGKLAVQRETHFRANILLFNSLPSLQGIFLYFPSYIFPSFVASAHRGRA